MYPSPFLQYWSGVVAFGDRFLHDVNGAPRRAPVVFAQVFGRDHLSFWTRLFFFGRDFQDLWWPRFDKAFVLGKV